MAEGNTEEFNFVNRYIESLTRESDDYSEKGYDFTRDGETGTTEDWVFIVVDLIAQKISSQKLKVMERSISDGVESVEFAADHPLNALLENPNDFQDYHAWMYNVVCQYILLGNSVVWYSHRIKQLINLRTSQIQMTFNNKGDIENYLLYATDDYEQNKSVTQTFKSNEIVHIRRPNPVSMLWGLSPFIAGRKGILFNRYSTDYLNSFYLKQATPGMIVEMDRQVNEATALRQLRTFESAYTGRRNQRRTMILPKGVTAKPSSHTIADQRITELIKGNRESILALLKVPKHEVGLQEGGSLGSEEYKTSLRNFWEATLKPTMRMIEGSLNKFFDTSLGDNHFLQFDISDVEALQENALNKAEIAQKMLAAGASVNEVRAKVFNLEASSAPQSDTPFVLIGQSNLSVDITSPLPDKPIEEQAPDADDLEDPDDLEEKSIIKSEDKKSEDEIREIVEGQKEGWLASVEKDFEELTEGETGEKVEEIATVTLTTMGEVAASLVKKMLKDTKAADIPDEKKFRKALEEAFERFAPLWEEEMTDTLFSTVEMGYNQQLDFVFNETDLDKIDALRARDENKRRAILTARGLDGFAYISETQSEKIMSEIVKGIEAKQSVDEIAKRVSATFADPQKAKKRARTIARTETLTAVSIGQGAAIENAATVIKGLRKSWMNVSGGAVSVTAAGIVEGDGRIRDQHLSMEGGGVSGEIVDHDKTFSNGLRWPRDIRSSDPAQVINCRCTVVMLTPGEKL
jgi:HK97 family phage portal protein